VPSSGGSYTSCVPLDLLASRKRHQAMVTCTTAKARRTENKALYPKLVITHPATSGKPRIAPSKSIEAVKQCVAAGMGVSVLISVAVEAEIEDGKLAALRWEEPFEVFTQMVWHEKRWKSPALRAFLETAREVFVR
jgi:DNA-binding transcriptional LysR family regulator